MTTCLTILVQQKDYEQLLAFHEQLKNDLIMVPQFPELDLLVTVVNKSQVHGNKLAEYFMRIHNMSADKVGPGNLRFDLI